MYWGRYFIASDDLNFQPRLQWKSGSSKNSGCAQLSEVFGNLGELIEVSFCFCCCRIGTESESQACFYCGIRFAPPYFSPGFISSQFPHF
jgi:hypothetical protein